MTQPADATVVDMAVDGVRYALRHRPGGSGRTVVLLHGRRATGAVWAALSAQLPAGVGVVAPDLPGSGGSEARRPDGGQAAGVIALALHCRDLTRTPPDADTDAGTAPGTDMPSVAVAAEPERPLDIVGHGSGGLLALAVARARPDLVRRVVCLATPDRRRAAPLGGSAERARADGLGVQSALVVCGSADRLVRQRAGERLADLLAVGLPPGAVQTVSLPGVGHRLPGHPEAVAIVAQFLA